MTQRLPLHQGVGEGATPFPRLLHLTLHLYLIILSVKQGGIKYYFFSLWNYSTWDWTLVSQTISEHLMSKVFANGPRDWDSIPGRVTPKIQKMVLNATLLSTQHYKVRIKIFFLSCSRHCDQGLIVVIVYYFQISGELARTYIQQFCTDTGCSLEDLPGAMDNRDVWQERLREIRAGSEHNDDFQI